MISRVRLLNASVMVLLIGGLSRCHKEEVSSPWMTPSPRMAVPPPPALQAVPKLPPDVTPIPVYVFEVKEEPPEMSGSGCPDSKLKDLQASAQAKRLFAGTRQSVEQRVLQAGFHIVPEPKAQLKIYVRANWVISCDGSGANTTARA